MRKHSTIAGAHLASWGGHAGRIAGKLAVGLGDLAGLVRPVSPPGYPHVSETAALRRDFATIGDGMNRTIARARRGAAE